MAKVIFSRSCKDDKSPRDSVHRSVPVNHYTCTATHSTSMPASGGNACCSQELMSDWTVEKGFARLVSCSFHSSLHIEPMEDELVVDSQNIQSPSSLTFSWQALQGNDDRGQRVLVPDLAALSYTKAHVERPGELIHGPGDAFTKAVLDVLEEASGISWADLLDRARAILMESHCTLKPQLSSNQRELLMPPARLRKPFGLSKALLIGINYCNTDYELTGCHNNVHAMYDFLTSPAVGFVQNNIRMMIDDKVHEMPTKSNLLTAFRQLISEAHSGDSIFIYYSGHSTPRLNELVSGKSAQENAIFPVDHDEKGLLRDSDIYTELVKPLRIGVQLVYMTDSCRSNSIMELPFQFEATSTKVLGHRVGSLMHVELCPGGAKRPSQEDFCCCSTRYFPDMELQEEEVAHCSLVSQEGPQDVHLLPTSKAKRALSRPCNDALDSKPAEVAPRSKKRVPSRPQKDGFNNKLSEVAPYLEKISPSQSWNPGKELAEPAPYLEKKAPSHSCNDDLDRKLAEFIDKLSDVAPYLEKSSQSCSWNDVLDSKPAEVAPSLDTRAQSRPHNDAVNSKLLEVAPCSERRKPSQPCKDGLDIKLYGVDPLSEKLEECCLFSSEVQKSMDQSISIFMGKFDTNTQSI